MGAYQTRYQQPSKKPTKKKNKTKLSGCWSVVTFLMQMMVVAMVTGLFAAIGGYIVLSNQLSDKIAQVVNFGGTGLGGTPRFYDRNGNLLFEVTTVEKRQWLGYSDMPKAIVDATVTVEDDTFWSNPGFDPAALGAALISNVQSDGRPVGASTITQQLVRHIAFSYEQRVGVDYRRKILEIFYAFILTQQRSKEDILSMYLNEIYYGNLAYGIEAASQTYFGKSARDLDLSEASFLAGIPQSPRDWNPYTNFEGVKERQEIILDLMVGDGVIDAIEAGVAKARPTPEEMKPLISVADEAAEAHLEAAHFVLYVRQELEAKYGANAITRNGWQITTSLDLNYQRLAEQVASEHVISRANQHRVTNAAVVALKPTTGEILAMVGSLDYFNTTISGQVNIALSPRQPGSSFKPITFVTAMQEGWTTGDVLWDVPIMLSLGNGEFMWPTNYDGRFHGPVLFRDALANSYNIPPIQLMREVGIPDVIATGRKMGIESLNESVGYYGLGLTLGGGEVPLLEMTRAYATLATNGKRPHLTNVLKIVDSAGNVVFDQQQTNIPPVNAIDPRIAYIMTDILSDNQARTPAMGANSALNLPFPAAAKTGTTNDYRDNWTIGYTSGVVVGVWSGNTNSTPMIDTSGLYGAAPIWNRIMRGIHDNPTLMETLKVNGSLPPDYFEPPSGLVAREVCLPRGTGGSSCTATRTDLFFENQAPYRVGRIGYSIDNNTVPGAWVVPIANLPTEDAQIVWGSQPELDDGSRSAVPTHCVVTTANPPAGVSVRLMLPIPPFYPDEVRARHWANQHGYQMAPATACPIHVVRNLGSGGAQVQISTPQRGQTLGLSNFPIQGSLQFDTNAVQSVYLQYGSGSNPSSWTTIGPTYTQPVGNSTLADMPAGSLAPGAYAIRVVAVNSAGQINVVYTLPITLQ